jgi:DNA-binding response OmpR family regulator
MGDKTVGIVEDDESAIRPLYKMLTSRKFIVLTATTVAAARDMIRESGEKMDVMVLDMDLRERITGAELAIQGREQHPHWTPEFLIQTGKEGRENYYRQALRLGAAAYLNKNDVDVKDVVRYVRVLALKRSLRLDRPRAIEVIGSISESTFNLSEAVRRFSRELLAEELASCLGVPYVLLLSDAHGTQSVDTNAQLPTTYTSLYGAVQTMAHGDSAFSIPYAISERDLKDLPARTGALDEAVFERLPGAVLLPLAKVKEHRLSLVLLTPQPGETEHPENSLLLARVLAQYVRPTIIEHFLSILVHLTSHRKAMLKSVAYFCLNLGQHQQRIIEEGVGRKELAVGSEAHLTMAAMADDLRQTGTILNSAAESRPGTATTSLDMRDLIETAFKDYRESICPDEIDLVVEGSCRVRARRDDMYVAIKRLLDWMVQRRTEMPSQLRPAVRLSCVQTDESSTIIFEDRSRRLPREFREHLFDPFLASAAPGARGPGIYLPLYVAKVLFEEKYGGRLDDITTEMEGELGHRFVVQFGPAGEQADTSTKGGRSPDL